MRRLLRVPLLLAGIAVILMVVVYWSLYAFASPRQYVGLGTPIRQDDFDYTVIGVNKVPALEAGSHQLRARGSFYIVTIRLDNHALRVPFDWDDDIVRIVDKAGHQFKIDAAAQAAHVTQTPVDRRVPAGSHRSFQTVFDLPKDIDHPAVVFENGILMGDAFDFVKYRRIAVALQ